MHGQAEHGQAEHRSGEGGVVRGVWCCLARLLCRRAGAASPASPACPTMPSWLLATSHSPPRPAPGHCRTWSRGEIVEEVAPPLELATPLLLVKPPVGLSTPEIFRALDLGRRSTADPRDLLARLAAEGATQELTVNDLEQPAFDRWGWAVLGLLGLPACLPACLGRLLLACQGSRLSCVPAAELYACARRCAAVCRLPALLELKRRLQAEGGGHSSAFMTGSGSTIVCVGSGGRWACVRAPGVGAAKAGGWLPRGVQTVAPVP